MERSLKLNLNWTDITLKVIVCRNMSIIQDRDIGKISGFDIFQGLNREIFESALFGASFKELKHREYLYRSGDSAQNFCIIIEGAIKLIRHSPKGDDIIVHFAVQGDIIGALLMNHRDVVDYPISAKSMGPTRVICIPKSTFQHYWQSNVNLQGKLNAILYRRMNTIQDDKTMSTSPLRVRIANLLLRHLDQESGESSQSLSLALTRQEIADALGVAVESVIRALREWQEDGTITRLVEKGPEQINIDKLLKHLEV